MEKRKAENKGADDSWLQKRRKQERRPGHGGFLEKERGYSNGEKMRCPLQVLTRAPS